MKKRYGIFCFTLFAATMFMMNSLASAHEKVVIVPLGGTVGNAIASDVVKGKTFSSKAGKGLTGTLEPPPCAQSFTNSVGMTFNLIPAGTFTMGSPVDEPGHDPGGGDEPRNETQRQVTLSKSYYMQTTEVTQAQWKAVIVDKSRGSNPSHFPGEGHPVERVNWYEAASFANWLSYDEGLSVCYNPNGSCTGTLGGDFTCSNVTYHSGCTGYRLPAEAQWEYAVRATTVTAFYSGGISNTDCSPLDPNLDKIGWYCGNADDTTHLVAWKQPNSWGLYDMSGNVLEWCGGYPDTSVTDPLGSGSVSYIEARGGNLFGSALSARSANQLFPPKDLRERYLGFRLVRPLGQ